MRPSHRMTSRPGDETFVAFPSAKENSSLAGFGALEARILDRAPPQVNTREPYLWHPRNWSQGLPQKERGIKFMGLAGRRLPARDRRRNGHQEGYWNVLSSNVAF